MQDASSTDTEANFDIEQFVHTSGEGFGNDRPMDADNGSVDVAALGSVAGTPTVAGKKMSRNLHISHTTLFMDTRVSRVCAKEKGHPVGCPPSSTS